MQTNLGSSMLLNYLVHQNDHYSEFWHKEGASCKITEPTHYIYTLELNFKRIEKGNVNIKAKYMDLLFDEVAHQNRCLGSRHLKEANIENT